MNKPVKKAVFPVAGLGTRFLPATKVIPKEMMPLVDRPLIQRAVEEAREAGIEEFIFVTGRSKSKVIEHFDIQPELTQALEEAGKSDLLEAVRKSDIGSGKLLVTTQQQALGLGHAVLCAKQLVGGEPFALFLPDVMVLNEAASAMQQMMAAYNEKGGNHIAGFDVPRELTYKYGILDVEDEGEKISPIKGMVEKPKPEDAPSTLHILGRYILQPEIFEILENQKTGAGGEIQLTDAMETLRENQPFYSVRIEGEHYDCGHHAGFIEANIAYALHDPAIGDEVKATVLRFASQIRDEG